MAEARRSQRELDDRVRQVGGAKHAIRVSRAPPLRGHGIGMRYAAHPIPAHPSPSQPSAHRMRCGAQMRSNAAAGVRRATTASAPTHARRHANVRRARHSRVVACTFCTHSTSISPAS
jgi:hypothetical protein